MSRSRPEKRNRRKGLEIEFKIECKVEEQKSTQKIHSKLTFFKRNGSFNAAINRICSVSIPNRVAQKNGQKRREIHWVIEFFDAKNNRAKKEKKQQSNIPSDLRKVCYFLAINQKCSLVQAVKDTSKKKRERTGFKWVVAAVMKSRQMFYKKQQSIITFCLDKRLWSGLQPAMKTEQKEDRKKKKEGKKKQENVSEWCFCRWGTDVPAHGGFWKQCEMLFLQTSPRRATV